MRRYRSNVGPASEKSGRRVNLDLRLVRYAVEVAEELHFGRAAAQLMISEQTLSAQIKQLEAKLGVALFLRDRRHVQLTVVGKVLVEHGRALLADADALLAAVAQNPAALRVDIVMEGLATGQLIAEGPLEALGAAIEIREGQGLGGSLPHLLTGELDFAFGRVSSLNPRVSSPLDSMLVRLQPARVMLPPDHPLASWAEIPMKELVDLPLLLQGPLEASDWRDWQEELVAAFGLQVSKQIHGHGPNSLVRAVLSTGCGALTRLDRPASGAVVLCPVVDPVPLFPWSMMWRRPSHFEPRNSLACSRVREFVSEQQWLTPPEGSWWLPEVDTVSGPDGDRPADVPVRRAAGCAR